jgi:hypothetical protein
MMATLRSRAAEDLAIRMLARGARDKLVQCHTRLSAYVVRDIRNSEFGGSSAKSGPLPQIAESGNTSLFRQMHRSLFAVLYRRVGGRDIYAEINIEHVIETYDIYLELAEPPLVVTFDEGWVIARELRAKRMEIGRCAVCGVDYLSGDSAQIANLCPYCVYDERKPALGNGTSSRRGDRPS